jgi:tetratricopeptide (TPR) repeat protein
MGFRIERIVAGVLCAASLCAAAGVEQLFAQGKFADALPILEAARQAAELAGRDDREVALVLNNLGTVYYELGRPREAQLVFERSLALRRELGETATSELTRTLNNLGVVYMRLNLLTKAEQTLAQAAAAQENLGAPPSGLGAAKTWVNLALVYQAEHRWLEAEDLFRKSLKVRERELGPVHRDVADSLNNLAVLLQDQKRFQEAEPLADRAVRIWEQELGPEHPKVAAGLHNLGVLYMNLGRLQEASVCLEGALRIAHDVLPADHPHLASYMISYAALLRKLDRKQEARELEKLARQSRERYSRDNAVGYTVDAGQWKR